MKTYPLTISSPDGDLYHGDVTKLILRGTEGELAVLAGHIPFVTATVQGRCVVEDAAGARKEGTVAGGLLTVGKDKTTLLTTNLTWNN